MLRQKRNHHRGKLASLGPVYGHCEGGLQFVEFREIVVHAGILEAHRDPAGTINYEISAVMRRADGSIQVDQCGVCAPGVTA